MSDIIAVAKHQKRVRVKLRIQMIAFGAALVGFVALTVDTSTHANSAVLGGIGVAALGVAIIAYVWSRIYGAVIIAKHPGPPDLR
ncbi:hypothetical protein [Curtobacterium sp. Leaf261]|uniref:hypothetical protein n=1 Tax=Curtobacterium sp. Leaf261 TaxID=1736311 RepID=UPI0006F23333|nr:hypothetical protein [Curtobacterium sp. Leaf261]KQO64834.1 hypothetical protein ASF23_01200 [Curtobacterium sp. Leaf261]